MESETIYLIVLLVFFFIYLSLLSMTKVVFTLVESYISSIKEQQTRFLAHKIEEILENRNLFSATISFGKSLAGTSFGICSFLLLQKLDVHFLTPKVDILVTIILVALTVSIPTYSIPKAIATIRSESLVMLSFVFYQINRVVTLPVAFLMSWIYSTILKVAKYDEKFSFLTDEEKERLTSHSDNDEALDDDEKDMIRNIFEFGETNVREIMVPRIDIHALNIDTAYKEVISIISEAGNSRIPVYEGTIDSIVGILYAKDVLRWLSKEEDDREWNLKEMLKKPFFVPVNKKLDDLMTEMKKSQSHMVIVVDEYGGTAGIATMEDILEEIVGDIHDEYDEEHNPIKQLTEKSYLVDPHIELDDLDDEISLPFSIDDKEYNTLGGLFYHEFGEVPVQGTEFEFKGVHLTIKKMSHQRIEEIILTLPESNDVTEIDNSF